MCDLEDDLMNSSLVQQFVQSNAGFAEELYAALCNTKFRHVDMIDDPEKYWACSWRHAGGIVADIEDAKGDYLDFYCRGNEGTISPRVELVLRELGWTGKSWDE